MDAPAYLKGLWAACCGLLNTGKNSRSSHDGGDDGDGRDSATWVRRSVEDVHALAASGDYNAVVACVGAGVKVLAGVKDIVSLRFVRGQSLLYDNVREGAATGGAGGQAEGAAADAKGDGSKLLQSAVLCGQYVVPSAVDETGAAGGNGSKILLGSTQEHVMSGQQVRERSSAGRMQHLSSRYDSLVFPICLSRELNTLIETSVDRGASVKNPGCIQNSCERDHPPYRK